MPPAQSDFQKELDNIITEARSDGQHYIDVNSGNLHRLVGDYPGRDHRMPICCDVMIKNMKAEDQILQQPPKGKGATLTVRYYLPR